MATDPYAAPGWWNHLPSVDGEPARLTREDEPDDAGRRYLADLQAALEARAEQPDVRAFLDGVRNVDD